MMIQAQVMASMAMAVRLLPQTGNSVIVFVVIQKCWCFGVAYWLWLNFCTKKGFICFC
jgi:hypothetical protein